MDNYDTPSIYLALKEALGEDAGNAGEIPYAFSTITYPEETRGHSLDDLILDAAFADFD